MYLGGRLQNYCYPIPLCLPGNYVATGGATLVNIQLQDPVYVDFAISENDLAQLRRDMGQGNTLRVDIIDTSEARHCQER
jgi:hypothetical protein